MNLGDKECNESIPSYEEVPFVETINHSVDIVTLEVTQNAAEEITTTICDEQAKADIYLAENTIDESKKKYKCPACEQSCTKRSNVRRHIRRFHSGNSELLKQISPAYCISCQLCEQTFSHVVYLKPHLTKYHGVQFDEQEYFFASSDEFLEWKTELEKQTDSVYIKQTGKVRRKNGMTYSYFKCNRSGNYKPKLTAGQRKRKLKPYGTVKMNSHCTSVMKLIHGVNGGINVYFCATHYGHDGFKECREAMLENTKYNTSKRNRKIIKVEDSKMIGAFVRSKELLHSTENSPLSNEHMVSMVLENGNGKNDLMRDKAFPTEQIDVCHGRIKLDLYNQDESISGNEDLSLDNSGASPNSSESSDVQKALDLTADGTRLTPKQKLVSNLRKLVHLIENCESDEVLDYVANGVDELVNRFAP